MDEIQKKKKDPFQRVVENNGKNVYIKVLASVCLAHIKYSKTVDFNIRLRSSP